MSTPLDFFFKWVKQTPQATFLRQPVHGTWHIYTYEQAAGEVKKIASGLQALELPPGSNIAILSKNCAHWIMADLAIMLSGHVSVPIYPTLSAAGVNQLLVHSGASVIFIGKLDDYEKQKEGVPEHIQRISFPFYGIDEGLKWNDLLKKHEVSSTNIYPEPGQLATIMYSSGTTGTPKGVMLSHGAFAHVGENVMTNLAITKPERFFSYLPLSHIAERALMEMVALASGSSISFVESLETFPDNLRHERPTIFGGVPRIYMKFQEGILARLPQKKLDKLLSIPILKNIIRKKIKEKLGLNEARIVVSGAAPTPPSLIHWFSKIGVNIREAYGMTENTAFSHANYRAIKVGSVGQPWPGIEVRLGEEGEVLVRHKALMKGYYKDPVTTSLVFAEDGFLRTGDQGVIDNEGFLFITGRIKDQFKTDKAKFVAPAPIELQLQVSQHIDQVCVVGIGLPQPIALVTLSGATRAREKSSIESELELMLRQVNATLESFEQLKAIIILEAEWTIANGLLTPSMKVKRNEVEKLYQSRYRSWYENSSVVIWE